MKLNQNLLILLAMCFILTLGFSFSVYAYNQAPMLDEKVEKGELPSVAQRLPEEPLVLDVVDQIGEYGGTWERAVPGATTGTGMSLLILEGLTRFGPEGAVEPNLARDWERNEDATEWTFHLRKGIRWSDGEHLTAEDLVFRYEYITKNEELAPETGASWNVAGEPVVIKALDEYTVRFNFPISQPVLTRNLAQGVGAPLPSHYLKQFHPAFAEEEKLEEKMKEAGFDTWTQLFVNRMSWGNTEQEIPTLGAWIPQDLADASRHISVRNPYYWKVDPEGNQLPYIDRIAHTPVGNREVFLMKAMSGDIDFQTRFFFKVDDYPMLKKNEEKGNYKVLEWGVAKSSYPIIYLNHNVEEKVMHDLINNLKFKKALSYAINRQEINDLSFYGLGTPRQGGVIEASPFYVEEHAQRYIEYDSDRANQLLDEIGLTERNSEGYRLRPDGKVLNIRFDTLPSVDITYIELIKKYWEDIGIKVTINSQAGINYNLAATGKISVFASVFMDRSLRPDTDPMWLIPWVPTTTFAGKYGMWNQKRREGGEPNPENKPPEDSDFMKVIKIYDEVEQTIDEEKRIELMKEIIDIHTKNLWTIGIVGELPQLAIKKPYFKNVPEYAVYDWLLRCPSNLYREQFYMEQE